MSLTPLSSAKATTINPPGVQEASTNGGANALTQPGGLTQKQLADQCGLHRTFIGSVERGERNVSILNLRDIAKILRVPLADLFLASTGRDQPSLGD